MAPCGHVLPMAADGSSDGGSFDGGEVVITLIGGQRRHLQPRPKTLALALALALTLTLALALTLTLHLTLTRPGQLWPLFARQRALMLPSRLCLTHARAHEAHPARAARVRRGAARHSPSAARRGARVRRLPNHRRRLGRERWPRLPTRLRAGARLGRVLVGGATRLGRWGRTRPGSLP
eukprot:scaffold119212_cov54-Phaeocystis_antarctica.AAC.2